MGQIQPADTEARRRALWLLGIAAVLGLCAILVFEHFQQDFQAWLEDNIEYLLRNPYVVFLAALLFLSPLIAAAVYLLVLANRTVRAQRFPPPNVAVSRDTAVLEGSQAVRRGRILQFLSILLLLAAIVFPFILWSIFQGLGNAR